LNTNAPSLKQAQASLTIIEARQGYCEIASGRLLAGPPEEIYCRKALQSHADDVILSSFCAPELLFRLRLMTGGKCALQRGRCTFGQAHRPGRRRRPQAMGTRGIATVLPTASYAFEVSDGANLGVLDYAHATP
jgi:hypothetical protein